MSITLFLPSSSTRIQSLSQSHSFSKPNLTHKPFFSVKKPHFILLSVKAETDNGAGIVTSPAAIVVEVKKIGGNGAVEVKGGEIEGLSSFVNPKWVNGTWDLNQFEKDGSTDWDAVIDAEVRRRKWFEGNPPSSSNDDPITFDTSIIPWWVWMKRFHLPEAELLNGRAAMIGFFMAYLVDSLTGVGLVDQMSNFFCKTLLFIAVSGVLLIRKNEDFDNIKKLIEESTFYDKQWQATWKDDKSPPKK